MADFEFKEGPRSYKGTGNRGLAALAIVYGTRLAMVATATAILITCGGYVAPGVARLLRLGLGL